MRLAVISDTHLPRGSRVIPQACLDACAAADAILHAGDFTTIEAVDLIRALGPPLYAVHGNSDTVQVRHEFPRERIDAFEGVRIAITHIPPARQAFEFLQLSYPDADAVVFGHTHLPAHEERDGFQIFNPGSPTERRGAPTHSMGIATIEAGRLRFELVALD